MKKHTHKLVTLKRSPIHNYGLYAKSHIAEDTPIIEYVGEKITYKEADRRAEAEDFCCIYFFELNQRYVLDGDTDYNLAKYINHTCEPNCYTDIVDGKVWIYAARDIEKGEELSYDYGFQRRDWHEHPCLCGYDECFGYVVAQEHWNAIRKTKRYQELASD